MPEILNTTFLANPLLDWGIAIGIALCSFAVLAFLKLRLSKTLLLLSQKTTNTLDDLLSQLVQHTKKLFLFVLSLVMASTQLTLSENIQSKIRLILFIAIAVQCALWASRVVYYVIFKQLKQRIESNGSTSSSLNIIYIVARIAVWSAAILMVLSSLGINISALVTGLGVGGVAIALALQNILGDLFASVSIALDKPFVHGDFIIVDDFMGTVEHIGLKTTRVRSLSGEQIIFANTQLLQSRIRNYKRMQERRILFSLGVTYQTKHEQLQNIPRIIEKIVDKQSNARFDRAHFQSYGDSSLNFEIVYYMLKPEYNIYMDTQQAINLEIYKQFQEAGIDFAYPTQTLFIEK